MENNLSMCVECADESGLNKDFEAPLLQGAFPLIRSILGRFLCIKRFNELYSEVLGKDGPARLVDKILQTLNVEYELSESDHARIPREGPVIVTANHPFGAIEGVALCSILLSARPDIKIMANHLLSHIDVAEFRDLFIFVDPFGKKNSIFTNIMPIKETIQWVKAGGTLGLFPAGEVSHINLRTLQISDPAWSPMAARIIRKTQASVLPVFFEGSNSTLFQLLGLIHPRLRTLMLPREMFNKADKKVRVKIGGPIPFEKLNRFRDDQGMTEYLRLRTYMLGNCKEEKKQRFFFDEERRLEAFQPVVPPRPADLMAKEVHNLPLDQMLLDMERFSVFQASAHQVPHLMHEIGRLREITFRAEKEGTGEPLDIDDFDEYYTHLFLWSKVNKEPVGAYRLGLTDRILETHGKEGLYTGTLFEYGSRFLERIGPAIELGRSFVRLEYQKDYHPLMLLWKGIARFVSSRPQYRFLFGPVSINNSYHSISRQLIVAYAKKSSHNSELAGLVRSRNPLRSTLGEGKRIEAACTLLHDIQDLSELISDIEKDRKGIPILLKHYMKLGGDILGFSIDHKFSDVIDALIVVDLANTDRRTLERYMGKEEARSYLGCHHGSALAEGAVTRWGTKAAG